jgi:hypothetical protein
MTTDKAPFPKKDSGTTPEAPLVQFFPKNTSSSRTKDPRERLIARLAGQIPFPHAPRGMDGGLIYAIVGIFLTSVFNIFMFCMVNMFGLLDPQYNTFFIFYHIMSLILGIFGIVCVVFLAREMNFSVNMAIIYSGIMFIHNYFSYHARPAILFPRYLAPISLILMLYFIFSKRVRNTYRWGDGDRGEDSTS